MKVIAFAVCVFGLLPALSACSAAEDAVGSPTAAPWEKVETPRSFATLSEEELMEAASANTGKVIAAGPVQEATAELTTWAGARARLADRGIEVEHRSPYNPGEPLEDTAVWLAILKGLFYEPQGPEPPPGPQEPICAEVIIIMVDPAAREEGTELASDLTLHPAGGCD